MKKVVINSYGNRLSVHNTFVKLVFVINYYLKVIYRNRFCASTDGSIEYLYARSSPWRESLPKNMILLYNGKTESSKT